MTINIIPITISIPMNITIIPITIAIIRFNIINSILITITIYEY